MSTQSYYRIIDEYFQEYNIEPFDVIVIESENPEETFREIRPDQIKKTAHDFERYNGHTVPPLEVDRAFTILLNKRRMEISQLSNNYDWVGTLIHEVTHVDDYRKYFVIVAAQSYDELFDHDNHRLFNCWTEYHARTMGHHYVMKYRMLNYCPSAQGDYIMDTELPQLVEWYNREDFCAQNGDMRLYILMQFLGVLSTWETFYPQLVKNELIHSLLVDVDGAEELYYFLKEHGSIEKVVPQFEQLHAILKKIYPCMP